jgi:succinate dehydrogenase / fumarate reductase iron-sulfur subunit
MTDKKITFKIKRQDKPGSPSYWQNFQVPHKPFANIISCLMEIQKDPTTKAGKTVAPVTWDSN